LTDALALVAPGTGFRDAIDNIIRAHSGALIVVASPKKLERLNLISGGIEIETEFTPMRLYELAKMDGAIIVSPDISYIHYVNVQLTPDPTLPSGETGLRHLAGHRTAQQTGDLVEDIGVVLSKANSALAALDKFTRRLREEARVLTVHEYEGVVPLGEIVGAVATFEYTVRIAGEIENYIKELGQEGRLVEMQLEQAFHNVPEQYDALIRDYAAEDVDYEEIRAGLRKLSNEELSDPVEIAQVLGYDSIGPTEEFFVKPRGYRQLERVPRLPGRVAEKLIEEFGTLNELLNATEDDLDEVEGVGQARARAIRRNLKRQQRSLEGPGEVL
jgi:diadenylate cyclase